METFVDIILSILSILFFVVICVSILSDMLFHKSVLAQRLYTMFFEKDDYKLYKEVKEYLKNHKIQLIPHTTLSIAQSFKDVSLDKYIFAAFNNTNGNYEIAIYDDNDTLCLTNFYNKLMQDLLNDAGYTLEDVVKVASESELKCQQLERDLEKRRIELEALEK